MTVIAWDGETLEADKMVVDGGGIRRTTTKIFRKSSPVGGDDLLAVTGSWDVCMELKAWWEAGGKVENFPAAAREDRGCLVVISKHGGVRSYNAGPYPLRHETKKCAFGSGRDFAEAAMFCGKTAEEAVQVAIAFQADCGNGVDVLRLKP